MSEQLRSPEELLAQLEFLMRKNGDYYRIISDGTEGLYRETLDTTERGNEIGDTELFHNTDQTIDWVTPESRAALDWSLSFSADATVNSAFADAAFGGEENEVNNVFVLIRTRPVKVANAPFSFSDFTHPAEAAYATKPCLIRANIVAPELFATLSQLLNHPNVSGRQSQRWEYLSDHSDPNDSLIQGLRTAYGILGKCVRRDDKERQYYLLNIPTDEAEAPLINDIKDELYE